MKEEKFFSKSSFFFLQPNFFCRQITFLTRYANNCRDSYVVWFLIRGNFRQDRLLSVAATIYDVFFLRVFCFSRLWLNMKHFFFFLRNCRKWWFWLSFAPCIHSRLFYRIPSKTTCAACSLSYFWFGWKKTIIFRIQPQPYFVCRRYIRRCEYLKI